MRFPLTKTPSQPYRVTPSSSPFPNSTLFLSLSHILYLFLCLLRQLHLNIKKFPNIKGIFICDILSHLSDNVLATSSTSTTTTMTTTATMKLSQKCDQVGPHLSG